MEPTEGTVTIDGVNIQQVGLARLRSSVTAIPQARMGHRAERASAGDADDATRRGCDKWKSPVG